MVSERTSGEETGAEEPPHTASLSAQAALAIMRWVKRPAGSRRLPGGYAIPLLLLAATPLATAVAAQLLAVVEAHGSRLLARDGADRIAAAAARARLARARLRAAPLLGRPTITGLADRLARTLPPDAHVHRLTLDAAGRISAEVDCADPETLRAAIAADAALAALRTVNQSVAGTDGVRVTLATPSA